MQELLTLLIDQDLLDAFKLAFVGAFNLNKAFPCDENEIALKKSKDIYLSYIETHATLNETIENKYNKYKPIKRGDVLKLDNEVLDMWIYPK